MGSLLSATVNNETTCVVSCKIVHDNDGKFVGLVPIDTTTTTQSRHDALILGTSLANKLGKGYDPAQHVLRAPGVPSGAIDLGIHLSLHNAGPWNGNHQITTQLRAKIDECQETFKITVNLETFKVLVGSPSNDESTGVIGYLVALMCEESRSEYERALSVFDGTNPNGTIPHVTLAGWDIQGYANTTDARKAYGLGTKNGELYPDGKKFYTGDGFPQKKAVIDESHESSVL